MNKEKLIALGLSEEVVEKVLVLHKESIDGNYVPKATFESERENSKTLKEQIAERDKQITELGKFKGTAEELQTKVTELETKNSEQKTQFEKELKEREDKALLQSKISPLVNDVSDIIPKLDMEKLVIKDGTVTGLDEQLEALKKSNPYYFKTVSETNTKPFGAVFGNKPAEGSGGENENNPEKDFGAQLAKSKLSGNVESAKKFDEIYFK